MAKPDNLFLRVLWALFFVVALVGNSVFKYQAVEQYLQFGVITTTKINKEANMTFPAISFCPYGKTQEMIVECDSPNGLCKWHNLTLYDKYGDQFNCLQLNHGMNLTELDVAKG